METYFTKRKHLLNREPLTPEALTEDEKEYFEERAGIRQYDGGMTRQLAEAAALKDVAKMRNDD